MKKIAIILLLALTFQSHSHAQSPLLDSARHELYRINNVFDSARYLGFDVNFTYSSDTTYGKYEYEELTGNYILNRRSIFYQVGPVAFMQNDSFAYDIYEDEKALVMSRHAINSSGSLFPVKAFVDSILSEYAAFYTINLRDENESRILEFIATDSTVPYYRFAVYYEPQSHYPDKYEVNYLENPEQDVNGQTDVLHPRKKKIVLNFSNYYHPNSLSVFDDSNYVYYDRARNQYVPAEKYRLYQFTTLGVNPDDETQELYPPPGGGQ